MTAPAPSERCWKCHGNGQDYTDPGSPCPECKGTGRTRKESLQVATAPAPAPTGVLTREESVDEKLRRSCAEKFDALIEPLRAVAREHGYALAVHGSLSLKRDIDLIAAPWIEQASAPDVLAAALRDEADRVTGCASWLNDAETPENANDYTRRNPHPKPHGRLAWSIHLGSGPYIDLSVMHPATAPAPRCACSVKLNEYARDYYAEKARADAAEAQRDALLKALREIADNPLPAEKGYECAWCNGVRKHHKECPCSLAAAALKEAGE